MFPPPLKVDLWCGYYRVGPRPYNALFLTEEEALDYVALEEQRHEEQGPGMICDDIVVLENVSNDPSIEWRM